MAVNEILNVKTDFGAVGDGVADDTAAIRKAVAEAIRLGGATVYLPCGTYRVAGIEATGTFSMTGDGESSVLLSADRTRSVVKVNNAAGAAYVGFRIKSTAAADYRQRNAVSNGFHLNKSDRCVLDLIAVENTYAAGIFVSASTSCTISRCSVRNTLADGIHLTGKCKDCTVTGNSLSDTGDDGIAVVSYLDDADLCERILIAGNHVTRSWARGISHVGGRHITISDNIVWRSASSGVIVVEDTNFRTFKSFDTIIHDNQIVQSGTFQPPRPLSANKFGVETTAGAVGVRIEGNTVKESQGMGISVSGAGPGTQIRDNHVYRNRDTGVQIAGADKILFSGNTVELNYKYGLYATQVTYGSFTHNQIANNNFFDMDAPGTGVPGPAVQSVDNANFSRCSDCTISGNISVDDRTDRSTARVERAMEILSSRRIKVGGNQIYVYNADLRKTITRESFLPDNQDCERMDLFTGTEAPVWKMYKAGQTYFRTDTKLWYLYDGAVWKRVALS